MKVKGSRSCILFLAIVAVLFIGGSAQARIKLVDGVFLDAYIRPRIELDARDFEGKGMDQYSTLRTRLGFTFENVIEDVTIYVVLGDSRSMGYSDPYNTGKPIGPNQLDDNVGMVEGWIRINHLFVQGDYLQAGRMQNNQGRNRIFGPGNWSHNGPRTYDGIKAGYETENVKFNVWSLYGLNGDRHWYPDPSQLPSYKAPYDEIDYKYDHTLNGFDLRFFNEALQFLAFLDYDQAMIEDETTGEENPASARYTVAVYGGFSEEDDWIGAGGLRLDIDAAYQFGTVGTTAGEADISAYLLLADLAYSFGGQYAPWAGIGLDVSSGDGGGNSKEVHNFYDYYYSRHTWRGNMDYFKNPFAEPALGLQAYVARAGVSPAKDLSIKADCHYFRTEQPYVSLDDGEDAHELGVELDVTMVWKIRKGVSAEGGFDFFWPTDDWQGPDADTATFIYFAVTGKV